MLKKSAFAVQYMWDTDFQPILAHQFRNWFMIFLDLNACYTQGTIEWDPIGIVIQRSTDKLQIMWNFNAVLQDLVPARPSVPTAFVFLHWWMAFQRARLAFQCIHNF